MKTVVTIVGTDYRSLDNPDEEGQACCSFFLVITRADLEAAREDYDPKVPGPTKLDEEFIARGVLDAYIAAEQAQSKEGRSPPKP